MENNLIKQILLNKKCSQKKITLQALLPLEITVNHCHHSPTPFATTWHPTVNLHQFFQQTLSITTIIARHPFNHL
jgi:hypothetical protein